MSTNGIVIDKHGRLGALVPSAGVSLELGCGNARKHPGAITVDAIDADAVDVVGDIFDVLARIPDGAVQTVYSAHFLEHIADLSGLVRELRRVLAIGGQVVAVVPHFSNPYYYSDPTHIRPFGLYSFSYLARDGLFWRQVPTYERDVAFRLKDVRLTFKAPRPFYMHYLLGRILTLLVNSTRLTQEWYEAFWCWLIPCYEIKVTLVRDV
jgi:SAM-dependent methyltransferase